MTIRAGWELVIATIYVYTSHFTDSCIHPSAYTDGAMFGWDAIAGAVAAPSAHAYVVAIANLSTPHLAAIFSERAVDQ